MKLNVLIADDHSIVRVGISLLIRKIRPDALIVSTNNFQGVIENVKNHSFDFIVIDINMPNGNFQSTIAYIKQQQPKVKVLIFSALDDHLFAIRLMQLGADGFLNKVSSEEEVEAAMGIMLQTGSYVSDEVKKILVENTIKRQNPYQNPVQILTNREVEIAGLLVKGCTIKEISQKLIIHVSTVSTYKIRILNKIGVKTIPELIEIFRMYNYTIQ